MSFHFSLCSYSYLRMLFTPTIQSIPPQTSFQARLLTRDLGHPTAHTTAQKTARKIRQVSNSCLLLTLSLYT